MKAWLNEIRKRNFHLFNYGAINFFATAICIILMAIDERQVFGANVWLKPMKFYLSVAILSWTMGWILHYLENKKLAFRYSLTLIVTMSLETIPINIQSIRGVPSHFNITSPFNMFIFNLMGVAIATFTVWTIIICIRFFRQKFFPIPSHMVWSLRLGLLIFIIFSIEGGLMVQLMKHTVGGEDGTHGLPVVNWSNSMGDLRVAHFFGIHALQIIPLSALYIANSTRKIFIFSSIYFTAVILLFIQALYGSPFL